MAIVSESPQKRRCVVSFDRFTPVTIHVGQGLERKEFIAHEPFIARSEFFRRALNGNWPEGIERIVEMPNDDPEHFRLYLSFVYTSKLPRDREPLPKDDAEWTSRYEADYMDLARIYALAEKLQDPVTKNAIVHRMFQLSSCGAFPPGKAIQIFYESTPESSRIRGLLPGYVV
ncbi:uncharacterized protein EI97DRAFT_432415 [Westerdykella ornata]|uniref:BTB domain-containing protein n=1 Tax=Westerdykella ornata TaxID=318751 RepID=A0A6A6JM30_WESOR|nr:uncharacterized protein EI97DRAFT_432415 [Westerdykella ornata]KAF2277552.1 hypothetical protein EI97DRAFT_432415 [Westerdykella ornata]